jgi:uncharacterized delta-60 repeat protein
MSPRPHGRHRSVEFLERRVLMSRANFVTAGGQDTSFGQSGWAALPRAVESEQGLAVQFDGATLAAASDGQAFNSFRFAITRLDADGTVDTSFGPDGTGTVFTDVTPVEDFAAAIAVGSDGTFYVAGITHTRSLEDGTLSNGDMVLVRYGPDGALGTTFGDSGIGIADVVGRADPPAGAGRREAGRGRVGRTVGAYRARSAARLGSCGSTPTARRIRRSAEGAKW